MNRWGCMPQPDAACISHFPGERMGKTKKKAPLSAPNRIHFPSTPITHPAIQTIRKKLRSFARGSVFAIFSVAMLVSIFAWILLPAAVFIMRQIVKHDDKAFGILGLWIDTKLRNPNKDFWNASSYAPAPYRRRGRRHDD